MCPKRDYADSADDDEAVLSQADVAVITASTIVNGTFAEVVRYADKARIRGIYGPSARLLPDVLFDSGIDAVMSVAICNPAQLERDMVNESDRLQPLPFSWCQPESLTFQQPSYNPSS